MPPEKRLSGDPTRSGRSPQILHGARTPKFSGCDKALPHTALATSATTSLGLGRGRSNLNAKRQTHAHQNTKELAGLLSILYDLKDTTIKTQWS